MLLLVVLLAQAAPAPPPAAASLPASDTAPPPSAAAAPLPPADEPSALACTFEAALRGAHCLYEASSGPGVPRDNSQLAAGAGLRACAAAAHGDQALRKECEKAVAEASLGDACARSSRIADAHGLLTAEARSCVETVRQAVAQTWRAAALSGACCKCLFASRCTVPQSQCRRELADLTPGAAVRSCLARSCGEACAFSAPPVPAKAPSAAPILGPSDKI